MMEKVEVKIVSHHGRLKMNSLTVLSYAKINLGLLLLEKRNDGFHDIATVFQQIDLHDELTFRQKPTSIDITSNESHLPIDETNLVHRAYSLICDRYRIKGGLHVHLDKQIPMGGGLGGGSSNAAATLLAVNKLWRMKLTQIELKELAIEIGSDVPFFLIGGTALGEGRGERLSPFDWPVNWTAVLVCPGIHVSTAWAYGQARIALTKEEKFTKFRSIFNRHNPHALRDDLINDLEAVVFGRHPILREIKDSMYLRGAFYASMSGSGSTIYGLFSEHREAEEACSFFSNEKGMTAFLSRPMSSHPPVM